MIKDIKHKSGNKSTPGEINQRPSDRAVKDTKQPEPTNQSTRKTDPSSQSFDRDDYVPGRDEEE